MALTTLAQGQNAWITFPAPFEGNMVFNALEWNTNIQVHDVTGVRSGTPDTYSRFENSCLGDIRGTAIGVPFNGTAFGYGCNCAVTLALNPTGTVNFKVFDYRLIKRFQLFDVTASSDSDKKWSHGRPTFFWTMRGFIPTTTDGLDDLTALGILNTGTAGPGREVLASFNIAQIGLFAPGGVSKIIGVTKFVPLKRGGPVEVQFQAVLDGAPSYVPAAGQDMDLIELTPSVGDLTIDMDDGVEVVHQIIVEKIDILADPRRGTPVRMILDWRYSA